MDLTNEHGGSLHALAVLTAMVFTCSGSSMVAVYLWPCFDSNVYCVNLFNCFKEYTMFICDCVTHEVQSLFNSVVYVCDVNIYWLLCRNT